MTTVSLPLSLSMNIANELYKNPFFPIYMLKLNNKFPNID